MHPDGANDDDDAKQDEWDQEDGNWASSRWEEEDALGRWEPPQCLDIAAPPPQPGIEASSSEIPGQEE